METYSELEKPKKNRPVFLTVLCILTFITTGFSFFGMVFNIVKGPDSTAALQQNQDVLLRSSAQLRAEHMDTLADTLEKLGAMPFYINDMFYTMLFMNFLGIILGLAGAVLMWRGKKIGFHSYILYNIVSILTVYVAVPVNEVPAFLTITNVIVSAIFIFMYSRNLKWLR